MVPVENNLHYTTVFENDHFIIVDKEAMVLSVPGREGIADERPVLGLLLEKDLGIKIYPVHRLDYEVQGLIMFAKTEAAHRAGNSWFEKKEVMKTYSALTTRLPSFDSEEFTINKLYLWKGKLLRGKKRTYLSPHGKDSLTEAVLIKVEKDIFHWEMSPITGRSHQLRFELFRHHHPIIGDALYSSPETFPAGGIALRSFRIDFSNASLASDFSLPKIVEIKSF